MTELEKLSDYEKICDFANLYKAHLRARRGKRGKREVIEFEMDLARRLAEMSRQLKARTYKTSGYYSFTIYEPKKREIFAAHYRDRVLLYCLCDEVLQPVLDPRLIYDNAACRPGKGTHFALDRFSGFLRSHYKAHGKEGWVLKCDISKYFASIDHEVLKRRLARVIKDRDTLALLYRYIDGYETQGRPGKGLPLGNQSSQWFAIYYLDPLDRLIKEKLRIKHYVRYMDDFLLIHESADYLRECLAQIRHYVTEELRLELNPKTQLIPLYKGITFLGWRFYLTETGRVVRKLVPRARYRMERRLARLQKEYMRGEVDLEDVKSTVSSYNGHLMHGNTYRLRKAVFGKLVFIRVRPAGQWQ